MEEQTFLEPVVPGLFSDDISPQLVIATKLDRIIALITDTFIQALATLLGNPEILQCPTIIERQTTLRLKLCLIIPIDSLPVKEPVFTEAERAWTNRILLDNDITLAMDDATKYCEASLTGLLPTNLANQYDLQDVYLNVKGFFNLKEYIPGVTQPEPEADRRQLPYDHYSIRADIAIKFVDTSPEAIASYNNLCDQPNNEAKHEMLAELAYILAPDPTLYSMYSYLQLTDRELCLLIQEKQLEIIQSTESNSRRNVRI